MKKYQVMVLIKMIYIVTSVGLTDFLERKVTRVKLTAYR